MFSAEVLNSSPPASGIYQISDVCGGKVHAFHEDILTQQAHCTDLKDGGWTVILRRKSDTTQHVNFSRSWNDYVQGFGDLNTEFWYGLRNIHCLTSRQPVQLRLLLNFTNGNSFLLSYEHFVVDRPERNYTLHVGQAKGPSAGISSVNLAFNNGMPFSTYDNDNDRSSSNCALGGGWWYNACNYCQLTHTRPQIWQNRYLDYVEMKVRSKLCYS
jgi:ficolin